LPSSRDEFLSKGEKSVIEVINSKPNGFTLIKSLIAVAVIAILAAIALPNLLEAQTGSKVSRVKSELRTIAGALEAYHAGCGHYPPWISNRVRINPPKWTISKGDIVLVSPRSNYLGHSLYPGKVE
jgi:type II secretory pathway pseudopilin PulG